MKPRRFLTLIVTISCLLTLLAIVGGVSAQQNTFAAPKLVANTSFLNVRSGPGIQYTVVITVVGGTELPVLGVAHDKVWYEVSTIAGVGWVNVEYTLPRGDFSVVPFVEEPVGAPLVVPSTTGTTGTTVGSTASAAAAAGSAQYMWGVSLLGGNFYTEPDDLSTIMRADLGPDKDNIYPILNTSSFWFQFTLPGVGTGWMKSVELDVRPLICPGINSNNSVSFDMSTNREGYVLRIDRGMVEMRFSDAQEFVALDLTRGRDESKVYNHCELIGLPSVAPGTNPATAGTTASTVTGSSSPGLALPRVVVNTPFLNVRSGPSAKYTIVATVSGGTELAVLGLMKDQVWYLVTGSFGQGWVNKDYVIFRGNIDVVPIIQTVTGGVLATPVAVVNGAVTLYAAPNATLGTLGAISGPVEVGVVARTADNSWVQVNTTLGFGWVQAAQVVLRGDLNLVPVVG